ncbi:MAG TPA: hypothetical protein VFP94_03145 [Terriglobales bacterium]|nr:hypothetical protein [Terriglobales bacterium]
MWSIHRLNFSQTESARARIEDASVYGTTAGFRGVALPGPSSSLDLAAEYSLTRNWVPALDLTYRHNAATGILPDNAAAYHLGSSDAFGLAPGIEYNLSSTVGLLLAMRWIPRSHNTGASLTPALAIDIVR